MKLAYLLRQFWLGFTARSSADYWERRYRAGMTSGSGSYGELARFKAEILNNLVRQHGVDSVLELGCGDGHQLTLARYPKYLGLDVSRKAIELCRETFGNDPTRAFLWYDPAATVNLGSFVQADLALSLDVIYHLLEDEVYDAYLRDLFAMSRRLVVIYSSDRDDAGGTAAHVRHRQFTRDVAARHDAFELIERIPNRFPDQTFAEFFVYRRKAPR